MQAVSPKDWESRLITAAVFSLGVSAMMTQLALMRELLAAFSGNELVLGIILGNWMLLTGSGACAGRAARRLRDPQAAVIVALLFLAIIPPVQIVALREFRDVIFIRGAMVGIAGTIAASLVLLAPYCLVSGGLLTLACGMLDGRDGAGGIGRVYLFDSAGSIGGGILFSFVLVHFFDHFALLCFPAVLNLAVAAALACCFRRRILLGTVVLTTTVLLFLVLFFAVDAISTAWQYSGQNVVFRDQSPYGRLVITQNAGQFNFVENGVSLFSTHDALRVEEAVHYAMAQRPNARNVLLISGGVSGTAKEILKYAYAYVTYVEIDPMIVAAGKVFLPESLNDSRIHAVMTDGRLFVKQTPEKFDVVIVDVPDPSTSQINRFYTAEFFGEVKRVLSKDGVLSFALGQYASYISPQLARMLASANVTLQTPFRHVLMLPGGRIFFLASDGGLTPDIAARLEANGIQPKWVQRHYLAAVLTPDRLADLERAVRQPTSINTDFNPGLYFYHLTYWNSQFRSSLGIFIVVPAILLAIYIIRLRPVPLAIFASGFAATAIEIVLLLGFQILCGSLYRQLGVIVTMFMLGLAIGAIVVSRKQAGTESSLESSRSETVAALAALAFVIAAFAALLPFALQGLHHAGSLLLIKISVSLLTFALALFVGMQFCFAGCVKTGSATVAASRLYTADFMGAFLGALLTGAFLIPLAGVTSVCLLAAFLNLAGGTSLLFRKAGTS